MKGDGNLELDLHQVYCRHIAAIAVLVEAWGKGLRLHAYFMRMLYQFLGENESDVVAFTLSASVLYQLRDVNTDIHSVAMFSSAARCVWVFFSFNFE